MTRPAVLAALALVAGAAALAAPPPEGSADAQLMAPYREWIETQHAQDGHFCCNLSDGRPTSTRLLNGKLQLLYSREHWRDGNDQWIDVPPGALLPQQSPVPFPIAWVIAGRVYCVSLPSGF